jgi:hypothetical protein
LSDFGDDMPQKIDSDCIKKSEDNLSKGFIESVIEAHQVRQ